MRWPRVESIDGDISARRGDSLGDTPMQITDHLWIEFGNICIRALLQNHVDATITMQTGPRPKSHHLCFSHDGFDARSALSAKSAT